MFQEYFESYLCWNMG